MSVRTESEIKKEEKEVIKIRDKDWVSIHSFPNGFYKGYEMGLRFALGKEKGIYEELNETKKIPNKKV